MQDVGWAGISEQTQHKVHMHAPALSTGQATDTMEGASGANPDMPEVQQLMQQQAAADQQLKEQLSKTYAAR